jgi:membrane associated rhomboid family serine protease
MQEDGEIMGARQREPMPVAIITIIVINVLAYLAQRNSLHHAMITPDFDGQLPMDYYFALSLDGIKRGFLWQLITFQFMHASVLHITLNCWAIYVFGRIIEFSMGWREMVKIYFVSGVMGGLTQIAGQWLLPSLFDNAGVVGASAGACGLVSAFAVLYPRQVLYLLLVFIPVKMKAVTLMWFTIALSVTGIFYPYIQSHVTSVRWLLDDVFGSVAHAAHLGGTLTGLIMGKRFVGWLRLHMPPVIKTPEPELSTRVLPD